VFEDFVNCDQEAEILREVNAAPPVWDDLRVRRSKAYGPPFSLKQRRFMHENDGFPTTPLPAYVEKLILPLVRDRIPRSVYNGCPNQLVVHRYDATKGKSYIMPHSDCENEIMYDPIIGLCLAGMTTMTLILPCKASLDRKMVKRDVRLPRLCLYVMSGDALRVWHHGIFPGRTDGVRYSLTFRRVLPRTQREHDADTAGVPNDSVGLIPRGKRLKQTRLS
jgi:2OG-Fe(II) oxygenase superfamily